MVTDIVKRLNSYSDWFVSCALGNVPDEAQMCMDAAKEIERLRAEVDYLKLEAEGTENAKRDLSKLLYGNEDELTQHLDVTAAAKRIFEVFCGGPVDWSRHALNDADDNIFVSADWEQAMTYARAALKAEGESR